LVRRVLATGRTATQEGRGVQITELKSRRRKAVVTGLRVTATGAGIVGATEYGAAATGAAPGEYMMRAAKSTQAMGTMTI
jgi:hypothetical protein